MINPNHLSNHVVTPVLKDMQAFSPAAHNLIMGTIAQESGMGLWIVQRDGGPALGICQMEPATHDDLADRYLLRRTALRDLITDATGVRPIRGRSNRMIFNLAYAVAMARLKYLTIEEPLPAADDVSGLAAYWKRYYNTAHGKGTENEFIANYKRCVLAYNADL